MTTEVQLPEPKKSRLPGKFPSFKFIYILLAIAAILITVFVIKYTRHDTKDTFVSTEKEASVDTEKNEPPTTAVEEAIPSIAKVAPVVDAKKNETVTEAVEEALPKEALSLKIYARELTWLSIKIDSEKTEDLLLRAGESTILSADTKFELKIGNAGGTDLTFNGKDIGNLGPRGHLVDITLP